MDQRLLLISYSLGFKCLSNFLGRDPDGARVGFVPTAGTPYEDVQFVERERELYRALGVDVVDIPLEGKSYAALRAELSDVTFVSVSGGNTYYLLQQCRLTGFDRVLAELVEQGLPYVGSSAGAVVLGPDIGVIGDLDDPAEAPGLTDYTGLGLVPFVALPHYGDETRTRYDKIVERFSDTYEVIPLRDDRGLLVSGADHRLIETTA